MNSKHFEIPINCRECKIVQSCTALPRWGTEEMLNEYRYRRHADCPYNTIDEFLDKMDGERREP